MEEGQEPTFLPTNIPQQSAVEEDAVSPVLQLSENAESGEVTEESSHVTEESSHVTEENDARSEEIGGYFLLSVHCCFDEIVCDKLLIISL